MNTHTLLFSLLLAAASSVQAQPVAAPADSLASTPLNLSQRPVGETADAALPAPQQAIGPGLKQATTSLHYGAGFEARQLGGLPGSSATGAGHSRSAGNGGRGGSGRGR